MKKWNNQQDKPIQPSFLIEVMALDILKPNWGRTIAARWAFFATLADQFTRRGRIQRSRSAGQ